MVDEMADYEVGYKKPPIATIWQKGQSGNPSGRPPKSKTNQELNPGKILQSIDNEELVITVDGERKSMRTGEIHFRQLFAKANKGDLTAARLVAKMAAIYFGPEAEGPSETRFTVVPDRKDKRARKPKRRRAKPTQEQVSAGVMFRKVAKDKVQIEVGGKRVKISYWDAYVRQVYTMALNKKTTAARLLEQMRRQFPGDLLPGDPIYFLISEDDAKL